MRALAGSAFCVEGPVIGGTRDTVRWAAQITLLRDYEGRPQLHHDPIVVKRYDVTRRYLEETASPGSEDRGASDI